MQTKQEPTSFDSSTIAGYRQAVERVILAMRKRLDEPLSLHEMAEIACLSPFHFDRVFHQTTGIPAVQFLYAVRIEAAKRLLLTTTFSVTKVCYEVGYNSIGTFSRRFTQLVGLSPRDFRGLATTLSNSILEAWFDRDEDLFSPKTCITGRLDAPSDFAGITFLGLFPTSIPQSHPVGGTLLTSTGAYHIGPVPDGEFYLFAAGFPRAREPLHYLLPDSSSLLVGGGERSLTVRGGKSAESVEIQLRKTRITDPPILISLPLLLANRARSVQQYQRTSKFTAVAIEV